MDASAPPANGSQPTADFDVRSPADGSVVASVPDQGPEEVKAAIARLRRNQPAWEALGPRGRGEWLGRLGDWLFDNDERIAELLQRETGKPWQEAALETPTAIDLTEYYRKRAERFLADSRPRPHSLLTAGKKLTITYRPYPVVGIICPWNFPILIALADAVPALLAGAAVAIKPSELTPLATREIVRGWREDLGAPEVLECLTGDGAAGAALVDEADYIQFTGSTRTGRKIAQRAAERLIPYSLELGGKDAMIVLADADLERAANGAVWGAMANTGQACTSVERVYVEEPAYDQFVALVVERAHGLRQVADGKAFDTDVGPLSSEGQLAIVERHVSEALAKGARALVGGKRAEAPGACYRADGACGRRPVDELHVRGVLRPDAAGDEGAGRRGGNPARQRLELRALGDRLDSGPRSWGADRAAPGGGCGERQRHVHECLHVSGATKRLEGVRRRRAARWRTGDSEVLPPAGDHRHPADPPVGTDLVPLHRPQGQACLASRSLPDRT